ncbi:39kDa subunit of ndufa9 [Mactra antiquata]
MASLARVAFYGAPRVPEMVGCIYVSRRNKATQLTTTNYKRGTGGRSSFSGIVATVFGAKSTLGHMTVNRLGKVGSQVIIPYRGDPNHLCDLRVMGDLGQILFHEFDLRDEASIAKCMQYSNVVINLIGQNFETRNFSFDDVHVEGARRIAKLAKEMEVERLIHVSTMNAGVRSRNIVNTGSGFLKSKGRGEQAVLEEFPEAVILRPSSFVDINDRFLNYYTSKPRLSINYGGSRRNRVVHLWRNGEDTIKAPVLPSDVAQGIVNAIADPEAAGKIFQCVGPKFYKLSDLVDFMFRLRLQGVTLSQSGLPIVIAKAVAMEKVYKTIGFPYPKLTKDMLEKETVSDVVDPSLPTLHDLGVVPGDIEDMMRYLNRPWLDAGIFKERVGVLMQPKGPAPVSLE